MLAAKLVRLGGLTAMVGGVAYATLGSVGLLTAPNAPSFVSAEDDAYVLLILGAMAAIVALHALQREHYGAEGALASLIAFVGVAMLFVDVLRIIIALLQGNPVPGWGLTGVPWLSLIGILLATLGILALGIMIILARVLPWWCGAALIAGSFVFAFLWPPLAAAWVVVGYAIFRAGARCLPERPSRVR